MELFHAIKNDVFDVSVMKIGQILNSEALEEEIKFTNYELLIKLSACAFLFERNFSYCATTILNRKHLELNVKKATPVSKRN